MGVRFRAAPAAHGIGLAGTFHALLPAGKYTRDTLPAIERFSLDKRNTVYRHAPNRVRSWHTALRWLLYVESCLARSIARKLAAGSHDPLIRLCWVCAASR